MKKVDQHFAYTVHCSTFHNKGPKVKCAYEPRGQQAGAYPY